jgi:hypothetical protein
VLGVQVRDRRHRQVQVQHLRDRTVWPGRFRQLGDLLERHAVGAGGIPQHQPVLALGIRLSGGRRLVARAVPPAKQLPVELRQPPGVGGVQHDLQQPRETIASCVHSATSASEQC